MDNTARRFYLWVLIGLFTLFKSLVLKDQDVFFHHGFAIINAVILAKVILVAEWLQVADNFKGKPLIYPIVFKSAAFCVLLLCFYIIEEVLVGHFHGKTIAQSYPQIGGGSLEGIFVVGLILFVGLIPFFAYRELAGAIGEDKLQSLVFTRGSEVG